MPRSRSETAIDIWRAGVNAVGGYRATYEALAQDNPPAPQQIIAVGKAAGTMAQAALDHYGPMPALVVTKDGHGEGLPADVQLIEAAHPIPDARSLNAGRILRETTEGMAPASRLLLLVSGGASSLVEDLVDGYSLKDLAALNRRLLAGGLDITAMNAQRRVLSRLKSGGLLGGFRGADAQVLAISDVPGDDLAVIGSGIASAPDNPAFGYSARIIASNRHARAAAVKAAQALELAVLANEESLHDDLDALVRRLAPRLRDMGRGVMVLGGEPTVVLPASPGRGGRNQALALALAREIAGSTDLSIVVGGTDGSDGPTYAAGAVVDGTTWGEGAAEALMRADSGSYLEAGGALLRTGPTGTNVMDLLIALRD
jgi:glycerate 2-kinase